MIVIVGIILVYAFSGDKNTSQTTSDNYGQYDKGTPLCDKGADGEINGLCK